MHLLSIRKRCRGTALQGVLEMGALLLENKLLVKKFKQSCFHSLPDQATVSAVRVNLELMRDVQFG